MRQNHTYFPSTITFPAEEVKVRADFDVIVVGGGMAGVCAAIASARCGAKTLLAESQPFVGGNAIVGLPMTTFRATTYQWPGKGKVVVDGIPREILEQMRRRGGFDSDPSKIDWMEYDTEIMQLVVTQLLDQSGVLLLCHSPLLAVRRAEDQLTHAVFLGKDDRVALAGKCFVDCSGDAALAYKAGLETPAGRARDGKTQPMTLVFTVGNINREKFVAAGGSKLISSRWDELRKSHALKNPRSGAALSAPTFIPNRPNEAYFNVTRILVDKGTDAVQLTRAEVEGRYQVEEFVEKLLRPSVPGFERCYLSRIANRVGVRETRRIRGEYELTAEDLIAGRKFADAVACNSYPVDIHSSPGGSTHYRTRSMPEGGYYTIPYRSLVACGLDNLLAAGRCLSATHEAIAAVRVNSCAMATGQAAGTAAALCAAKGVAARELSTDFLRDVLREEGAIVE